jgi:hypothetical protein
VFGDPTFTGWATAACYVLASGLAFRARGRAIIGVERRFWTWCAGALLVLAVNKQADAQTWLTAIGREFAYAAGLYEARRPIQKAFIGTLLLAIFLGFGYSGWRLRTAANQVQIAWSGLAIIGLYVIGRAASFHHTDGLLWIRLVSPRPGSQIELTGLAVISAAAALFRRSKYDQTDPDEP